MPEGTPDVTLSLVRLQVCLGVGYSHQTAVSQGSTKRICILTVL